LHIIFKTKVNEYCHTSALGKALGVIRGAGAGVFNKPVRERVKKTRNQNLNLGLMLIKK
jgi:hypothetical protein